MDPASFGWRQPDDKDGISAETRMGKGKDRITRSTSPSQVAPPSLKATAFHDDYDYHTLRSPPEVPPARKGHLTNVSQYRSEYPTGTKLHTESTASLESFDVNSYDREAQLRRAQLPYVKDQDLGLSKKGNTGLPLEAGQGQKLNRRLLQLDWLINENSGTGTVSLPLETNILNADSSLLWG